MAPNVDFKILHDDGAFASMLVRMQAGASLPAHGHRADEECYVVSGDIWMSGVHLRTGDFQLAGTDVVHDHIHSEGGCLLHIRASSEAVAIAS
jgi:anti-sigma factor ChrR (cupin superfamily)